MTKKVDLKWDYKVDEGLQKAIDKNCKEIPWEGTEVDKQGIINDIFKFFRENHYSILKHEKS